MIATALTVELVRFQPETPRAMAALAGLRQTAGARLVQTDHYTGGADWLIFWGPGGAGRAEAMQRQLAAGGHIVCADLSYWQRDRKVRISIDAPHPQAWVLRQDWPASRWLADGLRVSDEWDPNGPIVVAQIGDKARAQYGTAVSAWETAQMAACRYRWPGRRIVIRPKPRDPNPQIERALHGASLVLTWHSNVAVDAIRMGIPVVCQDGAAAAVCPATIPAEVAPLPSDVRDRFLHNLAWFQWDLATEGQACWRWLQTVLA